MTSFATPLHDAGFWAAKLVTKLVAENPGLEEQLREAMASAGIETLDANNVIERIYSLATADADSETWVANPDARRKLEEEADAWYGSDDVVIETRRPIERVDGGYWVVASVFVYAAEDDHDEGEG